MDLGDGGEVAGEEQADEGEEVQAREWGCLRYTDT
jgi:hypothetical protein